MALDLVDASDAEEPVDLDAVKLQVNLVPGESHPHDELILGAVIPAVRGRAELAMRRQVRGPVTYELWLTCFPCERWIEVPQPPLIEVVHVKYLDTAGDLQTFAASNYTVSAPRGERPRRGVIGLVEGATWPTTAAQLKAVQIRFTCGYSADEELPLPGMIKQALLMDAATLYANREHLVVGASVAALPWGTPDIYRSWRSYPTQRLPGAEAL